MRQILLCYCINRFIANRNVVLKRCIGKSHFREKVSGSLAEVKDKKVYLWLVLKKELKGGYLFRMSKRMSCFSYVPQGNYIKSQSTADLTSFSIQ
jgi:hypothetical protein